MHRSFEPTRRAFRYTLALASKRQQWTNADHCCRKLGVLCGRGQVRAAALVPIRCCVIVRDAVTVTEGGGVEAGFQLKNGIVLCRQSRCPVNRRFFFGPLIFENKNSYQKTKLN